jgi:hypothetical protein
VREDRALTIHTLMTHDLRTGETESTLIENSSRFTADLCLPYIVYALRSAGDDEVHTYNLDTLGHQNIWMGERIRSEPRIGPKYAVWLTTMPPADFRPVAGERLIDHRDF